ncbi:MAG: divalent cation tolerance protein CutA, partial [Planctomycetales bacterium]|nr:divalent cation tolerance protein CutA [Planctomycetales bacterium]
EGEVQRATEWLCIVKTTRERFDQLCRTIRRLHAYDEPEIIAMPVTAGSEGYLGWLRETLA